MSQTVNHIKANYYLDSVALMRMSVSLSDFPGVINASMMSATPSNLKVLEDAGLLGDDGRSAGPEDLVIAIKIEDDGDVDAVLSHAEDLLGNVKAGTVATDTIVPQSLDAACELSPEASLALISVPGDFAVREASHALEAGLHVMIFSDNISLDDELKLKQLGQRCQRLVMGPDCGTALIQGTPLAFANRVPSGDVGLIAASGTGLQEVSCLLAHAGRGISHAIGTGGRDLNDAIGGLTTLAAIDLLADDEATRELVLISKPAGATTRNAVLNRLEQSGKKSTVCFIGEPTSRPSDNVSIYRTLADTAAAVSPDPGQTPVTDLNGADIGSLAARLNPAQNNIHGLFVGGTLCAEAQLVLMDAGLAVNSNVAIEGAAPTRELAEGHCLLDLGADEYTLGRPHPMIEPAVRTPLLEHSLGNDQAGVVLLDVVLGTGSHSDPVATMVPLIRQYPQRVVIASVCGTDQDPQNRSRQVAALQAAGVTVAPSNAAAASLAASIVKSA